MVGLDAVWWEQYPNIAAWVKRKKIFCDTDADDRGMDGLISGIAGLQQASMMSKVQVAVAKKVLDQQKLQGAAAVQLIEAASKGIGSTDRYLWLKRVDAPPRSQKNGGGSVGIRRRFRLVRLAVSRILLPAFSFRMGWVAIISLGRASPRVSSDLPADDSFAFGPTTEVAGLHRETGAPGEGSPHIWSCCRWGLPCR
jgi:hypothetical protein